MSFWGSVKITFCCWLIMKSINYLDCVDVLKNQLTDKIHTSVDNLCIGNKIYGWYLYQSTMTLWLDRLCNKNIITPQQNLSVDAVVKFAKLYIQNAATKFWLDDCIHLLQLKRLLQFIFHSILVRSIVFMPNKPIGLKLSLVAFCYRKRHGM